jgi:hypothetical protein
VIQAKRRFDSGGVFDLASNRSEILLFVIQAKVVLYQTARMVETEEIPTAPWWVWLLLSIVAATSFWCQAIVTEERYG